MHKKSALFVFELMATSLLLVIAGIIFMFDVFGIKSSVLGAFANINLNQQNLSSQQIRSEVKVEKFSGRGQILVKDNTWRPIVTDTVVVPGETIVIETGSRLALIVSPDGLVQLDGPAAVLVINAENGVTLNHLQGKINYMAGNITLSVQTSVFGGFNLINASLELTSATIEVQDVMVARVFNGEVQYMASDGSSQILTKSSEKIIQAN